MNELDLETGLRDWMRQESSERPSAKLQERVGGIATSAPTTPALDARPRLAVGWLRPLALGQAAVIAVLTLSIVFLFMTQRPSDQGAVVPGARATDEVGASPTTPFEPKESKMKIKSPLAAATAAATLAVASVAAQEPVVPNEFEGHVSYTHSGKYVDGTYLYHYRSQEMSDPRFDGDIVLSVRPTYLGTGKPVWHGTFRIENEAGAWQAQPHLILEFTDGSASADTSAFIGEGDYEGLIAFTELDYTPQGKFDVRGVIVDVELPEPPLLHAEVDERLAGR